MMTTTMMMIREARPFKILACRWTIPPKYLSEPENQSSHKKKEYRQVASSPQPERKKKSRLQHQVDQMQMPEISNGNSGHQNKPNKHWANSFGSVNAS